MTTPHTTGQTEDHEAIWLQPACCADTDYERTGRQWCEHNVFQCEDGVEATKYIRADRITELEAEVKALREAATRAAEEIEENIEQEGRHAGLRAAAVQLRRSLTTESNNGEVGE